MSPNCSFLTLSSLGSNWKLSFIQHYWTKREHVLWFCEREIWVNISWCLMFLESLQLNFCVQTPVNPPDSPTRDLFTCCHLFHAPCKGRNQNTKTNNKKKDSLFQHKQQDWFRAASKINKQLSTLKNCFRDGLKEDQRLISLLQRMF